MWSWLRGGKAAKSTMHAGETIQVDKIILLKPQTKKVTVHDVALTIVPGSEMRCVMGRKLWARVEDAIENDESPLQQKRSERCEQEIRDALQDLIQQVKRQPDLDGQIKQQAEFLLRVSCATLWRAKFDLQSASFLPPMEIRPKPGATPTRVRRHYRWSADQDKFLATHLKDLVDAGVISHIESEWLCPIVLVQKNDDTWRLCVDPATLNRVTIPMKWEVPKIREFLQHNLAGCSWFSKFDFVAMF